MVTITLQCIVAFNSKTNKQTNKQTNKRVRLWSCVSIWGGWVLTFGLDEGVPLEPETPTHLLGSFWQKKVPIVKDFSWKINPFFYKFCDFLGFCHAKTNLGSVRKLDPCFRIFLFCKKRDPCLRISCKKGTH